MEEETSEEAEIEKLQGGGNSKRSLIFRVGKKIVITGAVITSAPFFLPPLIVVSTVGFAFAVPFGFIFASYACTQKVMSKLLPTAPTVGRIEDERDGVDKGEEEFEEDMKKKLEMRFELIGDENEARDVEAEERKHAVSDEMTKDMDGRTENMKFVEDMKRVIDEERRTDDNSVEEPVGGIDGQEEEKVVRKVKGFMGDDTIEERDLPTEDAFDIIEVVEEPVKVTIGVIQEDREGNAAKTMEEGELKVGNWLDSKEEKKPIEENEGVVDKMEMPVEERGTPVEEAFHNIEEKVEPVKETNGATEYYRGEGNVDIVIEQEEMKVEERLDNGKEEKNPLEQNEGVVDKMEIPVETREIPPMEEAFHSVEDKVEPPKETKEVTKDYRGEGNGNKAIEEEKMKTEEWLDNSEEEERPIEHKESVEAVVAMPVEEVVKSKEEEKRPIGEARGSEEVAIDDYILPKSIGKGEVPIEETDKFVEERGNEVNNYIPLQQEEPLEGPVEGVEVNGYEENIVLLKPIEVDVKQREMEEIVAKEEPLVETKGMIEEIREEEVEDRVTEEAPLLEENEAKSILITDESRETADESGHDLYDEESAISKGYISDSDDIDECEVPSAHASTSIVVDSDAISSKPSAAIGEQTSDTTGKGSLDTVVHYPVSSDRADSQPATYFPVSSDSAELQPATYYPVSPERDESQPVTPLSKTETVVHHYPVSSERAESRPATYFPVSSERAELQPATYYPVSPGRDESQPAKQLSKTETTIPSEEVLLYEKKMWKLMSATRKIVGYTAEVQASLPEELKALYVFTGIEPPESFKDPVDLVEVDDKLRLLMAIIGVK